jgi:hypothetical protein
MDRCESGNGQVQILWWQEVHRRGLRQGRPAMHVGNILSVVLLPLATSVSSVSTLTFTSPCRTSMPSSDADTSLVLLMTMALPPRLLRW